MRRSYPAWSNKFKNCEINAEEQKCSGKPKLSEDVELLALLVEDSYQTPKELDKQFHIVYKDLKHRHGASLDVVVGSVS